MNNRNKASVNLTVVKDSYSTDHSALFSSYACNKFSLTFEELKIKFKDVDEVIEKIMEHDKNIVRTDFNMSLFYEFYVLESDDNYITFDSYDNKKKVQINYYFHKYELAKPIFDIIQSFRDTDDELFVNISNFYIDKNKAISNTNTIKVKEDFKYNSPLYYPYLEIEELFKQYVMSDSNILLLCGTAGTGKTKLGDAFMGYLLDNVTTVNKKKTYNKESIIEIDGHILEALVNNSSEKISETDGIKVAYVKNEDILADDMFWHILAEEEFNLVFLDDLDYSLLPRTQNITTSEDIQKNKFISNLLSYTDGIFDAGNKTKFIITSNREVGDIDSAVLRKGRTFDIMKLRKLHNSEAKRIWQENNLPDADFITEFGEDTVLQADLGSTISIRLKAIENNVEIKPYIKEDGISLYNKTKNPKKMGL